MCWWCTIDMLLMRCWCADYALIKRWRCADDALMMRCKQGGVWSELTKVDASYWIKLQSKFYWVDYWCLNCSAVWIVLGCNTIKIIQSNFCDILVLGKSRSVVAHSLLSKLTNANHVIKFPSMQNNHGQPHYMLLVPYPLQGFFPTLPYPKSKSTNRHSLVVTHIDTMCVE